jgi:hypothetical protein
MFPAQRSKMRIKQRAGVTAKLWRACFFLPMPVLVGVATGCYAQSQSELDPPAKGPQSAASLPAPRESQSAKITPIISPAPELGRASSKSLTRSADPTDRQAVLVPRLQSQDRTGTVIPPPKLWPQPAMTDGITGSAQRLVNVQDRPSKPVQRAADPQVIRTATDPPSGPKAVARVVGVASPGLKITLDATESGKDLSFRWVQMRGPRVAASRFHEPRLTFVVPGDAKELAFMLVVYGPNGADSAVVDVPLLLRPQVSLPPQIFADAGDDQLGLVGHEITLNGARSSPRETAAFRWIQAEGPRAVALKQDGWICSFVPTAPGVYRFVLVVAADNIIAEPDDVQVTITGELDPGQGRSPSLSNPGVPPTMDLVARQSLCALPGGAAAGGQLAEAFEGIAQRIDLYGSYAEVQSEISRRLDSLVPADPAMRSLWNERLFQPLSARIADAMRHEGLDLAAAGAIDATLTEPQKNQLRGTFTAIVHGFKTASGQGAPSFREAARSSAGADQADRTGGSGVAK